MSEEKENPIVIVDYEKFMQKVKELSFDVEVGSRVALRKVDLNGPMYCGDGRLIDGGEKAVEASKSPKLFGGVLGVATLIAYKDGSQKDGSQIITQEHILSAKQRILKSGYTAGVHDLSGHKQWSKVHCGFGGLIGRGKLGFRFANGVTINWVVGEVGEKNQVMLKGDHQEERTVINLGGSGYTAEPDGSFFMLDPWVLLEMGFNKNDVDWLLALSVETVAELGGPKEIDIIV